jgi:hypothetical protein
MQLERHTLRQASTLTDLQYQQVLSNLALTYAHPGALPFYSLAGTGQTNISVSVNSNAMLSWDMLTSGPKAFLWFFDKTTSTTTGGENNLDQWTTASVLNPDELALMRVAYERTVGIAPDAGANARLEDFLTPYPHYLQAMRPGWVHYGCKLKVPHNACFVGHYGTQYAWVLDDGVEPLTELTLAILDIGTAVSGTGQGGIPGGPVPSQTLVMFAAQLYDAYVAWTDAKGDKDKENRLKELEKRAYQVALLVAKTQGKPPPQPPPSLGSGFALNSATDEVNRALAEEVQAARRRLETAPFLRPRKNLYNSLAAPTFNPP